MQSQDEPRKAPLRVERQATSHETSALPASMQTQPTQPVRANKPVSDDRRRPRTVADLARFCDDSAGIADGMEVIKRARKKYAESLSQASSSQASSELHRPPELWTAFSTVYVCSRVCRQNACTAPLDLRQRAALADIIEDKVGPGFPRLSNSTCQGVKDGPAREEVLFAASQR